MTAAAELRVSSSLTIRFETFYFSVKPFQPTDARHARMGEATPALEVSRHAATGPYRSARERLTDFLIQATLIESYHSFAQHGKPYPFLPRGSLVPGTSTATREHPFQRTALIIQADGTVPATLNKHIRIRRANEVNQTNLARLAPDIDRASFEPDHRAFDSPRFDSLLDRLLAVDYCLLIQQTNGVPQSLRFALTHMHVKIERLTDNAIRDLARSLGYLQQRLFERGESYVEALEDKYYEYFRFAPNASGRKSAAAMAAQLLAGKGMRFAVFASSGEDCRLTVLDESDFVAHHFLIVVDPRELHTGNTSLGESYVVATLPAKRQERREVLSFRARFRRTAAAKPPPGPEPVRAEPANDLAMPWLELVDETILPLPGRNARALPFRWSQNG
jgi:hypothetical protein